MKKKDDKNKKKRELLEGLIFLLTYARTRSILMSKREKERVQGFEYHRERERTLKIMTRNPRSHSEMPNALTRTSNSSLRRKAIDLIGRVGHQYDACQDKIVSSFRLLENTSLKTSLDVQPICLFIKNEIINSDVLLKILDIDDESILNVLFNTSSSSNDGGTQTMIFNYKQWMNTRRRILFYRQIVDKESIPLKSRWNSLQKNSLHKNTTHIITSIMYGLEFLLIFDVPNELPMYDVDRQLHRLCMILRTERKLSDNDTLLQYFDQLKIVAVFTNVPKFSSIKNMSFVYDRICKLTYRDVQPIFYYLHVISSIYPQINRIYRKITNEILYHVQTEFILIRTLLNEIDVHIRQSKSSQQYDHIRQRYFLIQQTFSDLLFDIYHERKHEHELVEYFLQNDFYQLVAEMNQFIENIRTNKLLKNSSTINILLLGETGVGKSTFINALANFLRYQTFPKLDENEPIVLIPTSFLVTMRTVKHSTTSPVRTDFQEIRINFGKPDSNECHNDQGQSVTQQCRSYSIPINDQTNLNLIDTPGIGDTRGLEQDKINMEHLSSFVQNLTHINAICILLKPNVERLHASFRFYLIQLFHILHSNVRKNIIFCFTNARSTLYMPGNTVPLLEEMLKQIPDERIMFSNANTFCFDSESFRYLVACKQGLKLTDKQHREYEQSWMKSAMETERFYRYIQTLDSCLIKNDEKSIEDIELTSCIF